MGDTFHYDHKFKMGKEDVFQRIVSWLRKDGAQITTQKVPEKVEAMHGSMKALKVWNINAEKRMSFTIVEDADGVNVTLVMEPASKMFEDDVYAWRNKIQTAWGQMANDIWASIEQPSA
jgi:hypothetical protein